MARGTLMYEEVVNSISKLRRVLEGGRYDETDKEALKAALQTYQELVDQLLDQEAKIYKLVKGFDDWTLQWEAKVANIITEAELELDKPSRIRFREDLPYDPPFYPFEPKV